MDKDKPFAAEGYELVNAAFEVHNQQGGGLLEGIYQKSLEVELSLREIPYVSQPPLPVFYKQHPLRTRYYPDFITHGSIVAEVKAVSELLPEHEAQLIHYLRIARQPVGYLLNFGPLRRMQWKRFIVSEFHE